MNNAQDAADRIKNGGRLFSNSPSKRHITKYSGSACNGGKVIGNKKSKKKNQLKKLVVGKENLSYRERRMGCVGSDGSCKRFKSPKMFFDDCNTDYQASVPRKLRSAIRKRSDESISPHLSVAKKIKHVASGVGSVTKDGLVKSNVNKPQAEVCVKDCTLELISKDEEEVAEALCALAAVFSDATKTDKEKMVDKKSGASSSALPKTEESINPFKEAEIRKMEEEPKRTCRKDDKSICSNVLDSATEAILPSLNGSKQPDISVDKQRAMDSGSHIRKVNLPLTAFASENECTIRLPNESVVSGAWTKLSVDHGSKLLRPDKNVPSCNRPQIAFEMNGASYGQPEVKCTTKENGDTGSSLRSGLSSRMSSDHEGAKKHPAWFRNSCSVSQSPISDTSIAKKDAQAVTDTKKSWMRCTTHAYICRFIKASKVTDQRDRSRVQYSQITSNEGSKQGPHDTSNCPSQVKNNLSGSISINGTSCSIPENEETEVRKAVLLHKRLVQDQQQASKSGIYNSQKQSLELLSLPTGTRVETTNSSNKRGHGPEALSPFPFPCLQSQYQSAVPFPTSQSYYSSSSSFSGYPSAAVFQQVHLPAFLGSMPPNVGASASTSSQPEQRQQQKRAPLLMAHYKSVVASPNVPNWQNGLPELSPMIHHAQILFSPSRSSGEAIGFKYAPIIQQQQQQHSVSATSLLPPSTVRTIS